MFLPKVTDSADTALATTTHKYSTDDVFLPKATDTAVIALQLLKMMTTDDLFFPIVTGSVVTALQLLTVISLQIECSFL